MVYSVKNLRLAIDNFQKCGKDITKRRPYEHPQCDIPTLDSDHFVCNTYVNDIWP